MSPSRESILVVDDEPGMCRLLQAVLGDAGYRVCAHQNPAEALKAFERERFDLVISDVRMPKLTGVDVLRSVKLRAPSTPVILVTAYGSTKTAVEAMKLGTSDFITKPFKNEEIRLVVESVLDRRRLASENAALRRELAARDGFGGMVGASAGMKEAFRRLSEAAECEAPVLITGPAGCGKALSARTVHLSGARAGGPFVALDCAAADAEARFFAAFEAADRGSLYLSRVSALPASSQSALLRYLQEGRLRKPGSADAVEAEVRLLASARSADGLRPELARRLAAVSVSLPSLDARKEDIPLLAAHFLERAAKSAGRPAGALTREALDALIARDWPGGVRELESFLTRSETVRSSAAEDELEPFRDAKQAVVEAFEKGYLERLMRLADGSVTRAAAIADMDRKNLYELLKKHGLGPRGE